MTSCICRYDPWLDLAAARMHASLDASLDFVLLGKIGMCMVCVMLEALRVGYFLP